MSRYDYQFSPDDDSTAARVCRMVGPGQRVLELGCAAGAMSAVLIRHYGCDVTGIEYDAAAADQARSQGANVQVADLNDPGWDAVLGDACFDVIIAADVLEHLNDPLACLRLARRHLADGGRLVISVPNIAHGGVLAALLCDEFPYRETGLLDRTHVHFFTAPSLATMLGEAGFALQGVEIIAAGPEHAEFREFWNLLPPAVCERLAANPAGRGYQVVAQARRTPGTSTRAAPQALPALSAAQQAWLDSLAADLQAAGEMPALRTEIARLRHALADLESQAAAALRERDQANAELRTIRQSRLWRCLAPLRHLGWHGPRRD